MYLDKFSIINVWLLNVIVPLYLFIKRTLFFNIQKWEFIFRKHIHVIMKALNLCNLHTISPSQLPNYSTVY